MLNKHDHRRLYPEQTQIVMHLGICEQWNLYSQLRGKKARSSGQWQVGSIRRFTYILWGAIASREPTSSLLGNTELPSAIYFITRARFAISIAQLSSAQKSVMPRQRRGHLSPRWVSFVSRYLDVPMRRI